MVEQKFQETFGFEPKSPEQTEGVRQIKQKAVDIIVGRLARGVEAAQMALEELGRVKPFSSCVDSQAVAVLADITQNLAGILRKTREDFEGAKALARAAGFTAEGEMVDYEVKRIFGLETIHQPPTQAEVVRINAVLRVLAREFYLAQAKEGEDLKRLPYRQPTREMVAESNRLKEEVKRWKERFWEAHRLAGKIGVTVSNQYSDYLPRSWFNPYPFPCGEMEEIEKTVKQDRESGLIS